MNNSIEIYYFKALESRYDFKESRVEVYKQTTGFEGEMAVNETLKESDKIIYAHDLEFVVDQKFQIDFLIVQDDQITILEVKHNYGDFTFHDKFMKSSNQNEYPLPYNQMNKSRKNLEKLCHLQLGINLPIKGYVIFSNPTFTPLNTIPNREEVLLRSEFRKFPKLFQSHNITKNKLILQHILKAQKPFSHQFQSIKKPDFNLIQKGIKCPNCRKMHTMVIENRKKFSSCIYCKKTIKRSKVYYFNLIELGLIKGTEGFTLAEAVEWCEAENVYTVRSICNEKFCSIGQRYKTYMLKEFRK
nr:nuclease-related domain-containing protein [Mammaliicoccus sp. Marseille-Q6498]